MCATKRNEQSAGITHSGASLHEGDGRLIGRGLGGPKHPYHIGCRTTIYFRFWSGELNTNFSNSDSFPAYVIFHNNKFEALGLYAYIINLIENNISLISSFETVKIVQKKDDFLQLLLGITYWSRSHLKDIIFFFFILATIFFFVKHIVSIIVIYIRAS